MKPNLSDAHLVAPHQPLSRRGAFALAILVAGLGAAQTHAVPFRVSQMTGMSTGSLGAVGASEGWAGTSGNYTVTSGSGSLDGTALGLYPSAGDKADIAYSSTPNHVNTYNSFASSGQYPPSEPINLYYSFLYRFNTLTNMSSTSSNKIVQVNRLGSGTGLHFDVHAITNVSGKIQLGVVKTNGIPAYSPVNVSVGETFFVVIRQQISAGGGPSPSGNDVIDLWVNPAAAAFGADEWSVPFPDASATVGGDDTSTTGPGRFYVIGGVSASFDELRIATNSWADVTPPASSCTPASFDTHPVDVTVSEGIGASFFVTSSSSSPIYQWQVSADGGTTWQDVTSGLGGVSASYTTAPLAAGDNQKQYRCIASVSCGGGSSATSGVAVVTVAPAVPTPPGVVLDDRFADGSRANAPVGISNSLWFASTANSLSDGSSGSLVGTPAAGTSRLWLGYFTDDVNQPVHLAVGRAIKASLTFKANGIVASGGTSMRFGLFDYADGGTRIAADGFGSGSTGNGDAVRGYMLTLDFGTAFSANTPETLYVRNVIHDNNLMGSTGNYLSLGAGPDGAVLNGTPAFTDDTDYTLDLTVTRSNATATVITASLTGGGTNYTTTVTDTAYAYPRFDAFAIRPNSLETTASSFTFSRLLVQVLETAPPRIPLNIQRADDVIVLNWSDPRFTLQASSGVTGGFTNVTGATSPFTNAATAGALFYRLNAH